MTASVSGLLALESAVDVVIASWSLDVSRVTGRHPPPLGVGYPITVARICGQPAPALPDQRVHGEPIGILTGGAERSRRLSVAG